MTKARQGTDWTDDELDIVVVDYFAMLADELAGKAYVKAHHREVVVKQIGRSHGSVEFKHQNISAVLQELGLPWIFGYKPAVNFQRALFDAIERRLSGNRDDVYRQPPPTILNVADPQGVFVHAPEQLAPTTQRPAQLERLVRKFDPVERDFRNRERGAVAKFVLDIERRRLAKEDRDDLAGKVRWVSMEDGDGAGYDILSFDRSGRERLIEVKTTNGAARTPFFLTRTELEVADERQDAWHLYRVHQFAQKPQILTVRPPLKAALQLDPETWRAALR